MLWQARLPPKDLGWHIVYWAIDPIVSFLCSPRSELTPAVPVLRGLQLVFPLPSFLERAGPMIQPSRSPGRLCCHHVSRICTSSLFTQAYWTGSWWQEGGWAADLPGPGGCGEKDGPSWGPGGVGRKRGPKGQWGSDLPSLLLFKNHRCISRSSFVGVTPCVSQPGIRVELSGLMQGKAGHRLTPWGTAPTCQRSNRDGKEPRWNLGGGPSILPSAGSLVSASSSSPEPDPRSIWTDPRPETPLWQACCPRCSAEISQTPGGQLRQPTHPPGLSPNCWLWVNPHPGKKLRTVY